MRLTRLLVSGAWLALAMAGPVHRAFAEPDSADLAQLDGVAQSRSPDVDLSTRRIQPHENGSASAWFETTRRIDPDGAEWWKSIPCSRSASNPWRCSSIEKKTVRVTPPEGGAEFEVSIPLGLSGLAAHRFINPGLKLIPQLEVRQACDPTEPDAVQQLEAVKRAFAQFSPNQLWLSAERGGFSLFVGANEVHFEFDLSRDAEPRIRCWNDGDELQ